MASEMTAAERMALEHNRTHQPYVVDAAEEEGPSSSTGPTAAPGQSHASPAPGKVSGNAPNKDDPLGVKSNDNFPVLGSSKGKGSAAAIPTWGVKANGSGNNAGSARPAAPVHDASATPSMTLPGRRNVETITIDPQHLLPRQKLRRPMSDIIKDINKKSRATISMTSAANGRLKFDATGPQDVAQQALKDLVQQIGVKTTVSVPIPQSARAHIIGKQGSTIKGIQERTGARINLPKLDGTQTSHSQDDDDDAEIFVTIEGNTISAASARDEILKIARERSANIQSKLRGIPSELYPFIAGPRNARAQALEEANGVKVQVPPLNPYTSQPIPTVPPPGQRPVFSTPNPEDPILLIGDRAAVQNARAEIERLAASLQQQLEIQQFSVQRGRHQFIVGNLGISAADFFADTGCSILLPADGPEENVTVIGPSENVPDALEKAMDLALGMQCSNFDVSRFHRDAPTGPAVHARYVTRYLRQRREIERLEKLYNTHINTPFSEQGALPWEIYSRDGKNSIRAQSEISGIINGHPPSRMAAVPVDPFFHTHLNKNVTPHVRDNYGVRVVLPDSSDSKAPVLLVYEGPASSDEYTLPRNAPSKEDVRAFEQGLQDARNHILELINKQENVISVSLEVPQKFHERLRRFIKKEQESIPNDQIPARVSSIGTRVTLRGPSTAVNSLAAKVEKFVDQEKEDEKERGFTMSFDFPQKFANHLIGKGGSNIRELRDKFDVEIQVQDGKVELKGPKAKAEAAKSHILKLGQTLADETTHVLKIDPKFHRELIGKEGNQVSRLQDRYKVQIFFPRSAKPAAEETDASSEGGKPRRQQAADEVTIRGARKDADQARDEIHSLHQYLVEHSHTATVTIQQKQVPSLIGQGGAALEDLRLTTGAKIDIPDNRDAEMAEIQVRGTKEQVAKAKKLLEEKKLVFDDTVTKTIDVARKHHKSLIGPGGANLRTLVVDAGGSDDRRSLARTIQFPKQDADGDTIKVEGRTSVVDKIIAAIQEKAAEMDSMTTETVDVPTDKHRALIGRGGDVKRQMESQFKVSIDVPRQGDGKTGIKITGRPENIEEAKAHIATLIKEKEGEVVQVPRAMHHAISNNGQFFRRLRNDFSVTVDHAGEPTPARPEPTRASGGSLPLITDDEDKAADAHSWTVVTNASGEEGDIPWVLRGSAENLARAKKAIQTALEQASNHDTTGYLVLPDPTTYRHVIGPGGSKVKAIRNQSGCRITVPRDQARDEPIEIVGSKDGVEMAKEAILAAVKEGSNKFRD